MFHHQGTQQVFTMSSHALARVLVCYLKFIAPLQSARQTRFDELHTPAREIASPHIGFVVIRLS
jgi:hypothetical protein